MFGSAGRPENFTRRHKGPDLPWGGLVLMSISGTGPLSCSRPSVLVIPAFGPGSSDDYVGPPLCPGAERWRLSATFWIPHRVRDGGERARDPRAAGSCTESGKRGAAQVCVHPGFLLTQERRTVRRGGEPSIRLAATRTLRCGKNGMHCEREYPAIRSPPRLWIYRG
jgi:hypothetical protein